MPAALYRFAVVEIGRSGQRPKISRERLFVRAVRQTRGSQDKLIHNFRESFLRNIAHKRLQNDVPASRIPPNRRGHNIKPNWGGVCWFLDFQDFRDGGVRLVRGVTALDAERYYSSVAIDA